MAGTQKQPLCCQEKLVLRKVRAAGGIEARAEARMENGTEAREANGLTDENPVTGRQCLQENRQDTYGLCLKTR